jgi:hypothetical protein
VCGAGVGGEGDVEAKYFYFLRNGAGLCLLSTEWFEFLDE